MKKILHSIVLSTLQALFWCGLTYICFTFLDFSTVGLFLYGFPLMFVGYMLLNLVLLHK